MLLAFLCLVTAVHDGDTLRCQSGTRVRLDGIDAPEIDRAPCRYRSCAPGSAIASRDALRKMAMGKTLRCQATGRSYERVTAWCSVDGRDVSCAMVRGGWAIHRWDRSQQLCRR